MTAYYTIIHLQTFMMEKPQPPAGPGAAFPSTFSIHSLAESSTGPAISEAEEIHEVKGNQTCSLECGEIINCISCNQNREDYDNLEAYIDDYDRIIISFSFVSSLQSTTMRH